MRLAGPSDPTPRAGRPGRRLVAAALVATLAVHTVYLLWVWPWPPGASAAGQLLPYLVSLLAGLPFIARLARRRRQFRPLPLFLLAGFVVLWLYSLTLLCAVRGMCL